MVTLMNNTTPHFAFHAPLADNHEQPVPQPLFGEQLITANLITTDQLHVALHEQQQQQQPALLGTILCRLGYLNDTQLCHALALRSGLAALDAEQLIPDLQLLRLLPHARTQQWQFLPLATQQGHRRVACADPFDIVAKNQLQAYLGLTIPITYFVAPAHALRQAIERSYGLEQQTALQPAPAADEIANWFTTLLREATDCDASDLHFIPEANALLIKMRVDGLLHTIKTMHHDFWPALLQRIKILAGVNIAETRRPQDGRFTQACGAVMIDCRIGFMPTTHGEAVALRLLDPRRAERSFAAMGFTPRHIAQFDDWLRRPEGLILVTGPTGSGKSTTLNAMLQALDHNTRNIMTLEDPVEYHFEGIRQTQVQEQHGMGFAEGVRTLLRHDPDIILIGEIRDAETAQQAMRAAMTGHLVLSSLHTNNAIGAVPRLLDLGLSRDMLAQHLRGVVAQRLVRTLCPHCIPTTLSKNTLRLVSTPPVCTHCFGTGRRGRTVVAELLTMPDDVAPLFSTSNQPYDSMWQHGLRLIQAGQIALDDLKATVPEARNIMVPETRTVEVPEARNTIVPEAGTLLMPETSGHSIS